ncbi:short-chain dehydrogenase/reductase SDR [Glycocaulis alkaliphilus]|uniref:Short-chain dehydrogenase/reductase SDR n=1 Tax=Glycocaulis alkaliphilus TaxID=1434191 RepID=A0A3T0E7W2_9PROT|nr:short-chain dehydrogenase/reductase SDR [Glycocaulis alkaliphilus]
MITGASRGVGLALAGVFAEQGWDVIATCREGAANSSLGELSRQFPGQIRIETLDVSDAASLDALTGSLDGLPIDILVNNAGITHRDTQLGSLDYDAWRAVLEVNLLAPVRVTEALLENVVASDQKKIVAISSSLGSISRTSSGNYFYRTSKAALNMAMRSLAHDLKERGVTIALLSPGYVDTDFTRGVGGPKVSVRESAHGLFEAMTAMTIADSGRFFRYTGEDLDW